MREKFKLPAAFTMLFFIFSFLIYFPLVPGIISAISAEPNYPDYSSYVNDFAGVLQSDIKVKTEDLITKVEGETNCEIAVAIINSLEGVSIEEYAVKLFEKWGVGKKKEDNGVLLLIAIEDRKLRIEV
ncbi:MAG: TPM domain-containing protein, partial [Actinobacteria bacterium]|nr:TPM domain-containing protein [Actinomycetota bacterium]